MIIGYFIHCYPLRIRIHLPLGCVLIAKTNATMQEKHTKLLQEVVNLLYYILIKMPQPEDLIPKPLPPETRWLDNQDLM